MHINGKKWYNFKELDLVGSMMFTVLGSYLCKVQYPKHFQLDSENAATIFRCIRWNKQNSCLLLFFTGKARWKFPDFLQEGFCCNSTFFFFFQFNQETQSNTSIAQRRTFWFHSDATMHASHWNSAFEILQGSQTPFGFWN